MGAGGGGGDVDEVEVGLEFGAETGTKLGEGGAVWAGAGGFGGVNFWGRGIKDTVRVEGLDGATDS